MASAISPAALSPWTLTGFIPPVAWTPGTYGLGYEAVGGAENLIQTTVPVGSQSVYTRATFEIDDVNDSLAHARDLAQLLAGLHVKINLIPMNPIPGSSFAAPSPRRIEAFRQVLVERRYSCFVRTRRGDDVSAACGQLALGSRNPSA